MDSYHGTINENADQSSAFDLAVRAKLQSWRAYQSRFGIDYWKKKYPQEGRTRGAQGNG
jgi:hypothetical protein